MLWGCGAILMGTRSLARRCVPARLCWTALYPRSHCTRGRTRRGRTAHSCAGRHGANDASTYIRAIRSWSAIVVVAHAIAVIVINGEAPAVVHKHDGTVEVAVARQTVPHAVAQQIAKSCIACCHNCHVVVVVVPQGHIVQIIVHTPDVVVVDAVYLVDDVRVTNAEGESHAVSQKTCVVAHDGNAHALSVGGQCSNEENDCGECGS